MSPFVFDGSPQEQSHERTLVLLLAMAQPRQDVVLAGPITPPHNTTKVNKSADHLTGKIF